MNNDLLASAEKTQLKLIYEENKKNVEFNKYK